MHISEGVLSVPALASGWVAAAAILALGLKKTSASQLPKAAVFGSAFFLASLVKVPVGGSSAHFALLGLMGLTLGYAAVPAIFIALFLQALLFQFGGLLSLGANTVIMALPALLSYLFFSGLCAGSNALIPSAGVAANYSGNQGQQQNGQHKNNSYAGFKQALWPFMAGFFGIACGTAMLLAFLSASDEVLMKAAWLLTITNLPLAVLEGIVTMLAVGFLHKASPTLLSWNQ